MTPPDLPPSLAALGDRLGALPREDCDAPLFKEPWQAQLFALTVNLSEAGHFTWSEWAATFADELARARAAGPNTADTYFDRWLAALQALLAAKGLAAAADITRLHDAWQDAYAHTPHGQPVKLARV